MFNCRMKWPVWMLTSAYLSGGVMAFAQSNAEVNAGIQFNFSIPGAKNLALGGAFLALADDATAAYANPAGLTEMSRPQFSIEARSWNYTHVFADREDLGAAPNGRDLVAGESRDEVTGPSFFSYVYPKRKWAVALYRHELANFEAHFDARGAILSQNLRLFPARSAMELTIVNTGIAAAYSLGKKEKFRVGIGASYYDFSIDSSTVRFRTSTAETASDVFGNGNEISSQSQNGDDTDTGFSAGFLWKVNEAWRVGGVYRQGPGFQLEATNEQRSQNARNSRPAQFHTPNVYGLGIAFQPTDQITVAFDYDHVEYSRLTSDLVDIFFLMQRSNIDPELERFKVDDADELHVGFEYFFLQLPVFLRFGAWYDPDHKIRFEVQGSQPSALQGLFEALFQPGDDETHYSIGFGTAGRKLQVDAAFDYSERVKTASLSIVIHFGVDE